MINITFDTGNYIVKNDSKIVGYSSNLYNAITIASKEANGNEFTIHCPAIGYNGKSKTFYACPKCAGSVDINGSLNTSDFDEYTKEEYAHCSYCNKHYIIVWMHEDYRT